MREWCSEIHIINFNYPQYVNKSIKGANIKYNPHHIKTTNIAKHREKGYKYDWWLNLFEFENAFAENVVGAREYTTTVNEYVYYTSWISLN